MSGPQLANPSITSPRQGDRSRASRVSPGNITGRRYAQQHAEQTAKEAAANISIGEVRKAARQAGFSEGWDAGFQAGWDALAAHLVEIGVLEPDEPEEAAE